jgi:hypothetical protein
MNRTRLHSGSPRLRERHRSPGAPDPAFKATSPVCSPAGAGRGALEALDGSRSDLTCRDQNLSSSSGRNESAVTLGLALSPALFWPTVLHAELDYSRGSRRRRNRSAGRSGTWSVGTAADRTWRSASARTCQLCQVERCFSTAISTFSAVAATHSAFTCGLGVWRKGDEHW